MGVRIVRGVLARDHFQIFLSIPPKLSLSDVIQRIKGRSSRRIPEVTSDMPCLWHSSATGTQPSACRRIANICAFVYLLVFIQNLLVKFAEKTTRLKPLNFRGITRSAIPMAKTESRATFARLASAKRTRESGPLSASLPGRVFYEVRDPRRNLTVNLCLA